MKYSIAAAAVASVALAMSPALGKNEGKLPKNARPLSAEETTKVYVGNTVKYNVDFGAVYYTWLPDGKLLGVLDRKNGTHSWADGTWTVKDNLFCFRADWKNAAGEAGETYAPCKAWYRAGKQLWTKNVSGDDDQYLGDIYNDEVKKMSKGDKVSSRIETVKASMK